MASRLPNMEPSMDCMAFAKQARRDLRPLKKITQRVEYLKF